MVRFRPLVSALGLLAMSPVAAQAQVPKMTAAEAMQLFAASGFPAAPGGQGRGEPLRPTGQSARAVHRP